MSWISADVQVEQQRAAATGEGVPAGLLGEELMALQHRPELAQKYAHFLAAIGENAALPARLAELLERRIRCIHGLPLVSVKMLTEAEDQALQAGEVGVFSTLEQAVLQVAEQMPYAHHELDEQTVACLQTELGAEGVVVVLVAAAFYDVNCRLALCLNPPASKMSNRAVEQ